MNTYTNSIREAITSALNTIRAAQREAFANANRQKATLLELLAEMRNTACVIQDMSDICEEAGVALLDIAEDSAHVAEVMDDSTHEFDLIPKGSYEGFVGFCGECGREIRADEEYDTIGYNEYICGDCMNKGEQQEERADEEAAPVELTESNAAEYTSITDSNLAATTIAADDEHAEAEVTHMEETVEA